MQVSLLEEPENQEVGSEDLPQVTALLVGAITRERKEVEKVEEGRGREEGKGTGMSAQTKEKKQQLRKKSSTVGNGLLPPQKLCPPLLDEPGADVGEAEGEDLEGADDKMPQEVERAHRRDGVLHEQGARCKRGEKERRCEEGSTCTSTEKANLRGRRWSGPEVKEERECKQREAERTQTTTDHEESWQVITKQKNAKHGTRERKRGGLQGRRNRI
eukprot:766610-Hanusia_phi.AAC.1